MTDDDEVQREARALDSYGLSDEDTHRLAAGIVAERRAWARLVRARAERLCADLVERAGLVEELAPFVVSRHREYDGARQALRDLGVDVDALLEEP